MNRFQKAALGQGKNQELVKQFSQTLAEHQQDGRFILLSWEDLYWLSKYLFDYDETFESDELIIKALEQAHASGMNVHNKRDMYLDGVMMLANKYLRYGHYIHTVNYLTELRDNDGDLPDWTHIYYCIAMTYAYPRLVLLNPQSFLDSLLAVNLEDADSLRRAQATVRRFLDQGIGFLQSGKLTPEQIDLDRIYAGIRQAGFDREAEWERFVLLAAPKNPESYLLSEEEEAEERGGETQLIHEHYSRLQVENQHLLKRLQRLEAHLELLQEKLAQCETEQPSAQPDQPEAPDHLVTTRRMRLLVFGDNRVPVTKLRRYANAIGFPADDIDFYLDYERNRRFDINRIQYHSPYIGILIGPNAHKSVNLDDYPSLISKLRNEPGFPHTIEMRTLSGELKITKTSFETALMQMMDHIEAISA